MRGPHKPIFQNHPIIDPTHPTSLSASFAMELRRDLKPRLSNNGQKTMPRSITRDPQPSRASLPYSVARFPLVEGMQGIFSTRPARFLERPRTEPSGRHPELGPLELEHHVHNCQ